MPLNCFGFLKFTRELNVCFYNLFKNILVKLVTMATKTV